MAIQVITEFLDKATVRVIAYVYDDAGALVDPTTSIKVSIWDPDGGDPIVDGGTMTQQDSTTGVYEYYYHKDATADAMDKGQWRGEVIVIDGAGVDAVISPASFSFKVM